MANFAAYTFAPAILVTPLGAMSVIVGAILASFFLDEKLGRLGICGCLSCIVSPSVIGTDHRSALLSSFCTLLQIRMSSLLTRFWNTPPSYVSEQVETLLTAAFLIYITFVAAFSTFMIVRVVPKYGQKNPMVYLSICSLVGSVSVMAIKGFGIALKLTIAGQNQLTHISTYVLGAVVVGCILVQMVGHTTSRLTSELLQQSPRHLLHKRSQPSLLRLLHNSHNHRLRHPLPRL